MPFGTAQKKSGLTVAVLTLMTLGAALAPFVLVGTAMPRVSPPKSVATSRLLRLPEGPVRIEDEGEGRRAILLLHGFNQNLSQWDGVWAQLEDCPVRRVRLDLPGFGESTIDSNDYSVPTQVARVWQLMDQLGIDTVVPVGNSMGGSIAAALAADAPERVERVALLAPSGYTGSLRHSGLFGHFIRPGMLRKGATVLARTRLFSRLFPRSAALQALTVSSSYGERWSRELGAIRAPTLVVWSRSDETAHASSAPSVAADIADSTLLWLDDATGHGIPSTRPQLSARIACELARGATPAGAVQTLKAQRLLRQDELPTL